MQRINITRHEMTGFWITSSNDDDVILHFLYADLQTLEWLMDAIEIVTVQLNYIMLIYPHNKSVRGEI